MFCPLICISFRLRRTINSGVEACRGSSFSRTFKVLLHKGKAVSFGHRLGIHQVFQYISFKCHRLVSVQMKDVKEHSHPENMTWRITKYICLLVSTKTDDLSDIVLICELKDACSRKKNGWHFQMGALRETVKWFILLFLAKNTSP